MWQNSLGHCVLKAEFPKGKKELAVSLFQVGSLKLNSKVLVRNYFVFHTTFLLVLHTSLCSVYTL